MASNEEINDLDNKSNRIQPDDPCNIQVNKIKLGFHLDRQDTLSTNTLN